MSESVVIAEEMSRGNRIVVQQNYEISKTFYGKFEQKGDLYIESQLIEISVGNVENMKIMVHIKNQSGKEIQINNELILMYGRAGYIGDVLMGKHYLDLQRIGSRREQ